MNIGISKAPAGILDLTPMIAPPTPRAKVARRGPGATGGNQTIEAGAAAPAGSHARAASDATNPPQPTRGYGRPASIRLSRPKASDISPRAVAAPAEEPHTAVVPGST